MRLGLLAMAVAGCTFRAGERTAGVSDGSLGDVPTMLDDVASDSPPGPGRRKAITIDGTKVTGTVNGFPLTIEFADPQLVGVARATVFFTNSGGTPIPYEIVRWVPSNGRIHAFVKVAQLANNVDTVIYLRYGDPSNVPPPTPAAVFAGYSAVWHLDDPLTTATIVDATGLHPATAINMDSTHDVVAQLAHGIDFDGNTNLMTFVNPLIGSGPHTISAWVSQRTARNFDTIVAVGTSQTNQSRWFYTAYTTSGVALGLYNNDWDAPGTDVQNAGWTQLQWVFEGSATNKSILYRDGRPIGGSHTHGSGVNTAGTTGYIGYAPAGWGSDNFLNGTLDEVRISTTALTPEWIATEFENQSSATAFMTVGPAQMVP